MTSIPGFTLVKRLPADSPGEVWWASSERADQLVTLHYLALDSSPKAEDQQRFMREAAICAQMQHPGLVRFLAQGITSDILWFATELIDSPSLQQFVTKRGPLTTENALDVLSQALEIVTYLHQQDVVHRSLRPESLLVEKQAGSLTVRLADLGSAKCFQMAELQPITKLGERGYAIHSFTAPEALLDFAKLDPRSDIYALGAILYFVLTGHPPYDISAEDDLELTILETVPPPLLTLKPGLPPTIANVVERAMARDIETRYSITQEMRAALLQELLYPPLRPNISIIRRLLIEALGDEELTILCFDHFREVHQQFTVGLTFTAKVQLLLEHCERNHSLDRLLAMVKTLNPNKYAELEVLLKNEA